MMPLLFHPIPDLRCLRFSICLGKLYKRDHFFDQGPVLSVILTWSTQEWRRVTQVTNLHRAREGYELIQDPLFAVVNNELKYFRTDSSYFPSQEHGKLFVLNTHGTNKGGEPYFQMIQHYQAQCVNMLQSRALQSSVLPCFGIDYVGPSLR